MSLHAPVLDHTCIYLCFVLSLLVSNWVVSLRLRGADGGAEGEVVLSTVYSSDEEERESPQIGSTYCLSTLFEYTLRLILKHTEVSCSKTVLRLKWDSLCHHKLGSKPHSGRILKMWLFHSDSSLYFYAFCVFCFPHTQKNVVFQNQNTKIKNVFILDITIKMVSLWV